MSTNFNLTIPYLIWAIICVVILIVIGAFCIFQIRRYLRRSQDAGNSRNIFYGAPPVPATVLVNSVSDTGAAAQRAAAMVELSRFYSLAAVQPAAQAHHAWYISEHTPTARRQGGRDEAFPPLQTSEAADTAFAAQHGTGSSVYEGEDDATSSASSSSSSSNTSAHTSSERTAERVDLPRHQTGDNTRRSSRPSALPPSTHLLLPFVSHEGNAPSSVRVPLAIPVAADPIPLSASPINPLSPVHLQRTRDAGQAGMAQYAAEAAGRSGDPHGPYHHVHHSSSSGLAGVVGALSHPSSFGFTPTWMRGRGRRRSSSGTSGTAVAGAAQRGAREMGNADEDGVVDGYCCDEHGNRLTVQQAEDIYGGATYTLRGDAIVVDAGGERAEEEQSCASVFPVYPDAFSGSDNAK